MLSDPLSSKYLFAIEAITIYKLCKLSVNEALLSLGFTNRFTISAVKIIRYDQSIDGRALNGILYAIKKYPMPVAMLEAEPTYENPFKKNSLNTEHTDNFFPVIALKVLLLVCYIILLS